MCSTQRVRVNRAFSSGGPNTVTAAGNVDPKGQTK